jgi:hypothetical protein
MKKRRFFELLNLCLDCEIDSRSAGELEHEILSNREHRRIYSEYCRIHRATRLVFERFRSGDVDGDEYEVATGNNLPVSAFDGGHPRSKLLRFSTIATTAGVAAAIALSVIVFTNRTSTDEPTGRSGFANAQTDQIQALPVVTFQAPYSTDLATDPYFRTAGYSNPFAFSANPMTVRVEDFSSSLRNATSFRLGTSNEVRAEQIEFEHIQLGRPEPQIFRSNPYAAPVSFEPVGFELHR